MCAAHFTEEYFLNLGVACQLCTKAVSISGTIPTLQGHSGASDSRLSKYIFLLKEFATDDSNVSFEQCREVLVVFRFSDHKCRHGNVYAAR